MAQADGPLPGRNLYVTFDGVFIDGVDGWDIDLKSEKKDITAAKNGGGVAWRKYMGTLMDAQITLSLKFLDLSDPGQLKLWQNLTGGQTPKELRLYEDATHGFFCDAYVEAFPIGSKLDDIEGAGKTVTFQIQDENGIQPIV